MADVEDKEKAEKLAAGRKRFDQLRKQKEKGKKPTSGKTKEDQHDSKEGSTETSVSKQGVLTNEQLSEQEQTPPRSLIEEGEEVESAEPEDSLKTPFKQTHNRQPSLSIESRLRSSSFRRTSVSQAPLSPPLNGSKSPILPVLSPEGESVNEIYRKQTSRLDELERENKRLAKEVRDVEARWKKSEEEIEDLRESNSEVAELKLRAGKTDAISEENEKLKQENISLQRQIAQLQSQTTKSIRHATSPSQAHTSSFPTSELREQLESKNSTIESMEMEISSLRSELDKFMSTTTSHFDQVSALEEKLDRAERAAGGAQRELADVKKSLDRASEKAVKEGSERTSAETKIRSLGREAEESKKSAEDSLKRIETLEKKLAAVTTLHKESDSRRQAGEKERERNEKEVGDLRRKLAVLENENLRLREERERSRKREAGGVDDDGVDELEDEERRRLEDKVQGLESEVFDLRRGIWREKRRDLSGTEGNDGPVSPGSKFDEVDLSGGPSQFRRQSFAASSGQGFANVISSGFNAITGGGGGGGQRESQELLDGMDDGFDEEAFRLAQEEESRKRVERVREIKRGLKEWEGWRMDIVDSRIAAGGANEIFDI